MACHLRHMPLRNLSRGQVLGKTERCRIRTPLGLRIPISPLTSVKAIWRHGLHDWMPFTVNAFRVSTHKTSVAIQSSRQRSKGGAINPRLAPVFIPEHSEPSYPNGLEAYAFSSCTNTGRLYPRFLRVAALMRFSGRFLHLRSWSFYP